MSMWTTYSTRGDIAKELRAMKMGGVTRGSVLYCVGQVWWEHELYNWDAPNESHGDSSRESHDDSSPDAHEDSIVTRTAAEVLEADVRDWQERWAEMVACQTRINETLDRLEMALELGTYAPATVTRKAAYTPGGKLVPDAHTGGGLCK